MKVIPTLHLSLYSIANGGNYKGSLEQCTVRTLPAVTLCIYVYTEVEEWWKKEQRLELGH